MFHARSLPPALLVMALALLAGSPALGQGYIIENDGRSIQLPTIRLHQEDYLELNELAEFFGFRYTQTGRRSVRLTHEAAGVIELRMDRALVEVRGQPILLNAEIKRRRKRFYVPVDFVTRAIARVLEVEARHDRASRMIRFDRTSEALHCETFSDRTRITLRLGKPPVLSEVIRDGRRRVVEIKNQELPNQVGGCLFDETVADLEVRAIDGRTRITFFVGPRFANLQVHELPESMQLVFDFFNDSTTSRLEAVPAWSARSHEVFDTIVLDPGHGGADHGASGLSLAEKDLTLDIALRVADLLRQRAAMDVTLTRVDDTAIGLTERTEIANRKNADLFLSIHANATVGARAYGAETYFLNLDGTADEARTHAARDGNVTGLGRQGSTPGTEGLEMLLWDMAQQQYLDESSRLAESVQAELNRLAGTFDRGVKQANFLVLRGATMPAVLVEVGFLSSPAEERRMEDISFVEATAEALYKAILTFRDERQDRNFRGARP